MSPPTPLAFVLLVLLLPGVWLAGSAIARRLTQDHRLARLLSPALGLALWLLAVHIASLAARSFWIGLPVGTVLVATAGGIAWRLLAQASPAIEAKPSATSKGARRASKPEHPSSRTQKKYRPTIPWTMVLSAFLATAYLAPTALGWWFHDEVPVTGHLSMTSQIQNGIYPPRHLSFPELELRYHYGFNLLAAAVGSMLRLKVDNAIDLVTLLAWGYSWCLAWTIGERLVGPGWGAGTAAVVLFGGGMPVLSSTPTLAWRLAGFSLVGNDNLNPPVVSYFFQHPWTLGIPLALATLLVVSEREAPDRWTRLGAIGALLVALSFSQVVLFLCFTGALVVNEAVAEGRHRWTRSLWPLLLLGAVVLIASRLHGFFVGSMVAQSGTMLEFRPLAFGGSLGGWVSWELQSFGLLLPLGVAGLLFLARERLLIALLAGGSLLVQSLFQYRFSWDIVKFATVTSLSLSIGAAASLRRLFQLRPRPLGLATGTLGTVGVLAAGLLFPLVVGFYGRDLPFVRPVTLSVEDARAVDWLRRNVRPGEIVYRQSPVALGYAQWGGLPQLQWDAETYYFGVPRDLIERRTRIDRSPVSVPDDFLRLRVRWLVLDLSETSRLKLITRWTSDGRAAVRAQFGPLTIIEILGAIPSP